MGSGIGSNDDDNDYDVNEDCSNLWVVIGMPKSIKLYTKVLIWFNNLYILGGKKVPQ